MWEDRLKLNNSCREITIFYRTLIFDKISLQKLNRLMSGGIDFLTKNTCFDLIVDLLMLLRAGLGFCRGINNNFIFRNAIQSVYMIHYIVMKPKGSNFSTYKLWWILTFLSPLAWFLPLVFQVSTCGSVLRTTPAAPARWRRRWPSRARGTFSNPSKRTASSFWLLLPRDIAGLTVRRWLTGLQLLIVFTGNIIWYEIG